MEHPTPEVDRGARYDQAEIEALFDTGLWTFDEAGRLWVNPEYDPDDSWMHESLRARHGERLDRLRDAGVTDEYLAERNESLGWWPPN